MLRQQLLEIFESHKGELLSGGDLSAKLGVSRNAVWKAVHSLRQEGYDISSVSKSGYRLEENSDVLSEYKLRGALGEWPHTLDLHKRIDSTSLRIEQLARQGAKEWTASASEQQSSGRGHRGGAFLSPDGKGIYLSVLLRPSLPPADACRLLPKLSAVCVSRAIRTSAGVSIRLSPDGNPYWGNKKLGGLLTEIMVECETGYLEYAILGIGVNIYACSTPESQREENTVSLFEICGTYCNRSELIAAILLELYSLYPHISSSLLVEEYQRLLTE